MRTLTQLATRMDGFINRLTGLGTTRDKRTHEEIGLAKDLTQEAVDHLYRGNDIAARIVDALPEEALRKSFEVSVEEDEGREAANELQARADELGVRETLLEGWRWGRAFGGAAVILGVDDGRDMSEPLDIEPRRQPDGNGRGPFRTSAGRPLRVLYLHVVSRWELSVQSWDEDPDSTTFGEPLTYTVASSTTPGTGMNIPEIHASRILRFFGDPVPPHRRVTFDGWGTSVLARPYEVIRDFGMSWDGVANLLQDASQAVYGVEGLDELLSSNAAGLMKRLEAMDKSRSVLRAAIIDSESESFERKPTPFSGIPETLQMFVLRMAAAGKMPATILMGQSPAGMNATGESDIRWWYNRAETAQQNELRPKVERILRLLAAERGGDVAGISVTFPSLWEATPKEEAERRHLTAQTDQIYMEGGVALPEEIAMSRFGARGWSPETSIDVEARRELLEADRQPAPTDPEQQPVAGGAMPDPSDTDQAIAQVTAIREIVRDVAEGVTPKESAVAMIVVSFPVTTDQAWQIIRPIQVRPPTPAQPPEPPPAPAEPLDDSE